MQRWLGADMRNSGGSECDGGTGGTTWTAMEGRTSGRFTWRQKTRASLNEMTRTPGDCNVVAEHLGCEEI